MARQEKFCQAVFESFRAEAPKELRKIPMLVVPSRSSPPKRNFRSGLRRQAGSRNEKKR